MNFRLDQDLRDKFVAICKKNDTTASQELRKFVKSCIKDDEAVNTNTD